MCARQSATAGPIWVRASSTRTSRGGRRRSTGAEPPAQISIAAGSCSRRSPSPATTWFGLTTGVNDKRNDVDALRPRRRRDLPERRLYAERHAARALERKHRLGHQHAEAMRLLRERRQQHARPLGADGNRRDRAPQQRLHGLRVQMLLEDLQLPTSPGLAHERRQRRQRVSDEPRQSEAQQRLRQLALQVVEAMLGHAIEVAPEIFGRLRRVGAPRRAGHAFRERVQFRARVPDDLPGRKPWSISRLMSRSLSSCSSG